MIRILLTGAAGKMGRATAALALQRSGFELVAGIDINAAALPLSCDYPIFPSFSECGVRADVIIDFSHHTALEGLLVYAMREAIPVVVATTGHTAQELALLKDAAQTLPIFHSQNLSLGVNILTELVRHTAAALDGFDIEIVEKHHKNKLDAPSGTALMLADAAASARGRASDGENPESGIGIHSVRGGTIVGEHEVIFAGSNEVITLTHSASSREIYAEGALRAAAYIVGKPAGLYDMRTLLADMRAK